MLKIRLQRIGRRNDPSYRVVVVESAVAAKKGVPVEILGFHDTVRKKTSVNGDRVQHWIANGAKPSDTLHNILIQNGIIEGTKQNVLPKKQPIVKNEEEREATTEAPESQEASEGEQPTEAPAETAEEGTDDKPQEESATDDSTTPSQEG
ncbi:MAG: 30S ribosomal protein S16 [Candidatus Kaiserbacteria bacterium]|nr:30S ribosomal protein S16 [Candidatus Kaiserbacteria bacterium]